MRNFSLLVVLIFGMFTLSAMAQGSAETRINQNSGNAQQSTIQGCVVKSGHNYYLQPTNGGNRVELNGAHDFSNDVGHEVRLKGDYAKSGSSSAYDHNNSATLSTNKTAEPASSTSVPNGNSENSNLQSTPNSSPGAYFTSSHATTISSTCSSSGSKSIPSTSQ